MGQGKDYIPLAVGLLEITEQQRKDAALTCAGNASDRDELRMFLEMLGLIDAR